MSNRILVTYASRAGSTVGVAEAIGQTLAESGAQVEVRPMQDVTDLTLYRAVVAGSAIQGKRWLPEAMQFVQVHRATLAQKPFAVFLKPIRKTDLDLNRMTLRRRMGGAYPTLCAGVSDEL